MKLTKTLCLYYTLWNRTVNHWAPIVCWMLLAPLFVDCHCIFCYVSCCYLSVVRTPCVTVVYFVSLSTVVFYYWCKNHPSRPLVKPSCPRRINYWKQDMHFLCNNKNLNKVANAVIQWPCYLFHKCTGCDWCVTRQVFVWLSPHLCLCETATVHSLKYWRDGKI